MSEIVSNINLNAYLNRGIIVQLHIYKNISFVSLTLYYHCIFVSMMILFLVLSAPLPSSGIHLPKGQKIKQITILL